MIITRYICTYIKIRIIYFIKNEIFCIDILYTNLAALYLRKH